MPDDQWCLESEGLRTKSDKSAEWSSEPHLTQIRILPVTSKVRSQAYRSYSASLHQKPEPIILWKSGEI